MHTFLFILSKFFPNVNVYELAYTPKLKTIKNINFTHYSFMNIMHHELYFYKTSSKYRIFKKVLQNPLINENDKMHILNQFNKSQFCYLAFNKLAYIFKYNKARTFKNDTDLCFVPLKNYNNNIILDIYDNNLRYKFKISDIISIINKSLSNTVDFFCEPLVIRNPYTNVAFSKSVLYNIYYALKESSYIMPSLFHNFFLANFNLNIFLRQNEATIRDFSINQFILNASYDQKCYYVTELLDTYNYYFEDNNVLDSLTSSQLLLVFSPYIKLYLYSNYSLNPELRAHSKSKLKSNLNIISQLSKKKEADLIQILETDVNSFANSINTRLANSINTQIETRYPISDDGITWTTNPLTSEHYYRHIQLFRPVLDELDNI